ncbi:MAG: prolipoprotein diacylglyceryl transferase [Deltaproteobacteria bacterium]|nr:prolipoprotein diacylglyceryl transferase [Deltaproteobacteria bacterium]
MHPILVTVAGKDIHFYQVVYPLTILMGVILCVRRAKKEGFNEELMMGALIASLVGVIVGSRLLDVIVNFDWYWADPVRIFNRKRGIVLYGGFIGAVAGAVGYTKFKRHPYLPFQDIASTYFGLGLAIHRSGACFMAGCCYGAPTDLPWGVIFPEGSRPDKAYGGLALHPSQLYEALLGLLMFGILMAYRAKKKERAYGEIFGLQLGIYGVGRFLLEFMRGDASRGRFGFLSTSQWISIAMLAGCVICFIYAGSRKKLVSAGKLKPAGVFAARV